MNGLLVLEHANDTVQSFIEIILHLHPAAPRAARENSQFTVTLQLLLLIQLHADTARYGLAQSFQYRTYMLPILN